MENIRIGVVGIGNMGSFHADALYTGKVARATLGAVCDTDPQKRELFASRYPDVPVFASHTEMIASSLVDAIIVAVPHYGHCDITVDALDAGLHVICEKPEAVRVCDARRMNESAKRSGKVFSMMFNQRTNPIYARAKELVASGALGERKRLTWIITNWYRTQAYYDSGVWRATWSGEGGGVLLNQAPHNLDLWQWIFGMPESISATCKIGKYHNIEVEDDVCITAEYAGGATAQFITTTGEFPGTNRLEMVGDRAKMVIEDGKLKIWRLATPEREFCFASDQGFAKIPTEYEEYCEPETEEGHIAIIRNFVGAVLDGTPLIAPGVEGINELTLSNAAYLSAWTGKRVDLPLDTEEFDKYLSERIATSKAKEALESRDSNHSERWKVCW